MAEYTKGNWEAKEMANGCWAINAGLDNRKTIVQVWNFPEVEANADLIAAAPEMYEALKVAKVRLEKLIAYVPDSKYQDFELLHDLFAWIDEALSKAEAQNASKQ
jgi:hypothetical protein